MNNKMMLSGLLDTMNGRQSRPNHSIKLASGKSQITNLTSGYEK
jgi:hypothetical protein